MVLTGLAGNSAIAGAAGKTITALSNKAAALTDSAGGGALGENLGLEMRFSVTIGGTRKDLGDWASCQGLGVNFNPESLEEGGNYQSPHLFPGKMTYTDVVLERAITTESWTMVRNWLREVRTKWVNYDGSGAPYQGDIITIILYGSAADAGKNAIAVASWNLLNAIPISWTGPSLKARSSEFATERLTLRHQGLLD